MITDRIGRRKAVLSVNHKYYNFRGCWKGQNRKWYIVLINDALESVTNNSFGGLVVVAVVIIFKFVIGSFKVTVYVKNRKIAILVFFSHKNKRFLGIFQFRKKKLEKKIRCSPRKWDDRFPSEVKVHF